MTNKEAIEKLGYIKNQYHVMFKFTDYDEVFDLAIKALEAYDKILPLLDPDIDAELALEKIREVIYD